MTSTKHDNSDDDPVVATFDVFNAASLAGSVHMFQFPLRSAFRPYEHHNVEMFVTDGELQTDGGAPPPMASGGAVGGPSCSGDKAAVIQPASRVTLHCDLDTFNCSDSFTLNDNNSRGVVKNPRVSMSIKQEEATGDDLFGSAHRYHYALRSEPFVSKSEYAVGVFREGGLHLTSVSTVQQFVPAVSSVRQSFGPNGEPLPPGVILVEPQHTSKKPEDVGFTTGPIADMINRQIRRQRSFAINTDGATAKPVEYFRRSTVESSVIARRLYAASVAPANLLQKQQQHQGNATPGRTSQRLMRPLDALFPPEVIVDHGSCVRREILMKFAGDASVAAQVRDLMQSCQVLSIPSLQALVVPPNSVASSSLPSASATTTAVPVEALLEALRGCAMFVHGVWVAKGNERFRGNAAGMREVILLKFWQSKDGSVRRDDLNQLVRTRGSAMVATIKEILETVSVRDEASSVPSPDDRRWRLKELPATPDAIAACVSAFQQRHPEDCSFQTSAWSKRVQLIMGHVATLEAGKMCRSLYLPSSGAAVGGGGPASAADGVYQRASGPMPLGASPSAATATAPSSNASAALLADPNVVKVREFTRRLFLEHGVINKQRAKESIAKARQDVFPEATNHMLSAAVQEEVHQFTAATWILKTLKDSELDAFRPFLVAAVLELDSFESRAAVQLATDRYNQHIADSTLSASPIETIPQRVVQRVLNELAEFKSGERLWHVKSGNVVV